MIPNRISLHDTAPEALALADGEIARVTLAWFDGADPVFVRGPTGLPCTAVIRWPTDASGRVDAEALRRGDIHALRWDLTSAQVEDLRWFAQRWALAEHDVHVVGEGRVRLRFATLRRGDHGVDLVELARPVIERLGGGR